MSEAVTVTSVLWSVNNKPLPNHLSVAVAGRAVRTTFSSSGWVTTRSCRRFVPSSSTGLQVFMAQTNQDRNEGAGTGAKGAGREIQSMEDSPKILSVDTQNVKQT